MCELKQSGERNGLQTLPVTESVGTVLAHDITEIRPGEFKGRAFKKGHVISEEDVSYLQRLGKENLYVLKIADNEMHEDDAAYAIAGALKGEGVKIKGAPKEGKITLVAEYDGLLSVNKEALMRFNVTGDVMCATLHNNTLVKEGQSVAGTRAIPLVVKRDSVEQAVSIAREAGNVLQVKKLRRPNVGIVITGNEVYFGRIKDAFAPVITQKIEAYKGKIIGLYYAPDDESYIESRLRELIDAGADLLITTGGMSVDPDDVTRFAIRKLAEPDIAYGSSVLPGSMFLVAYVDKKAEVRRQKSEVNVEDSGYAVDNSKLRTQNTELIPIMGIPACGMYAAITVFDLVLPRILAGEKIGRTELAELGHGGLCLKCDPCRYPVCPFGKQ